MFARVYYAIWRAVRVGQCLRFYSLLILFSLVNSTAFAAAGDIAGKAYNDKNYNGIFDTGESGVAGVVVTATHDSGSVNAVTDTNGNYSFSGIAGTTRVDFTLPTDGRLDYLHATIATDTWVRFVDPSAGVVVNAGFHEPSLYATGNPDIITNYQHGGNQGAPDNETGALVSFPYNSEGISAEVYGLHTSGTTTLAKNTEIGTTWGLAYARSSKKIYTATFLKRHAGLVSGQGNELGNIWVTDLANGNATTQFVNVSPTINVGSIGSNTDRGITGAATAQSEDFSAYGKVGKWGLGDLDISADEKTLYTVSLATKELLNIDIASKAITSTAIPDPGCTLGEWRPFGLAVRRGALYVGGVCDGSEDTVQQFSSNLDAYVYRYDGSNFTQVLKVDLDYNKGSLSSSVNTDDVWFVWTEDNTWPVEADAIDGRSHPQPMLTDIDFDLQGNMLLGFADRWGNQTGSRNLKLDGATIGSVAAGGDIIMACIDNSGSFQLENNGSCNGVVGAGVNNNEGFGSNGARGEFFVDNFIKNTTNGHRENVQGGIAVNPFSAELLVNSMDPVNSPSANNNTAKFYYRAGGPAWFALEGADLGKRVRGFHVYRDYDILSDNTVTFFGKGHAVGDIELLLDPAPIEIGNRVWFDANANGVQDPTEAAIANVTVVLTTPDNSTFTTTTNAAGEYYFNNSNVTAGIQPHTQYQLSIDLSQTAVSAYSLTTANANAGSVAADQVDSDATSSGGKAVITVQTGAAGANDHSLDFGFSDTPSVDVSLEKAVSDTQVSRGATLQYTLTVRNHSGTPATNVEVVDELPTGVSYVSDDGGSATNVNAAGRVAWSIANVPANGSQSLVITVTVD